MFGWLFCSLTVKWCDKETPVNRRLTRLTAAVGVASPHMTFDEIRSAIWKELDEEFPGDGYETWPTIVGVYDGYCIVQITVNGKYGLYRIDYTIKPDETVAFDGDPLPVESRYVEKGTLRVVATAGSVLAGDVAAQLIADLKAKNPLFAALTSSANGHLAVFDLTTIGRPSQHHGPVQYQLATAGLAAAAPTLIGKPVHVTADLDGHFTAGQDPKAVGVFMGSVQVPNADGSICFRAVASLWEDDFPDVVENIQANIQQLGGSYEIEYDPSKARRLSASIVEIPEYRFTGGAILDHRFAAHHETRLLIASDASAPTGFDVMDDHDAGKVFAFIGGGLKFARADVLSTKQRDALSDSDFALVQTVNGKKVRRFPIQDETHRKNAWARLSQAKNITDAERTATGNRIMSRAKSAGDAWAKNYSKKNGKWTQSTSVTAGAQGGTRMPKYLNIPDELEAIVEALIGNAVRDADTKASVATREVETLTAKVGTLETAATAQTAKVAELEAAVTQGTSKVNELTVKLEATTTELTTKSERLNAIDKATKLDEAWKKIVAEYHIADTPEERTKRQAQLDKLAAGEGLSIEDWKIISSGGITQVPKPGSKLRAGLEGGSDRQAVPNREAVVKAYPQATARTYG